VQDKYLSIYLNVQQQSKDKTSDEIFLSLIDAQDDDRHPLSEVRHLSRYPVHVSQHDPSVQISSDSRP
jgi:hypothetical protein